MKEIKKFLNDIEQAKNGYDLGEPWKFSKDAMGVVIPILCSKEFKRDYTTFPEVKSNVEFQDLGGISPISGKSGGIDLSVFIRAGTVLEGKSGQDRAVIHGMMMQPNQKKDVDVRCVHASRPTSHGGKFAYSGLTPRNVQMNLRKGQSETWKSVSDYGSIAMCNFNLAPEESRSKMNKKYGMSSRGGIGRTNASIIGGASFGETIKSVKHDDLPSIKKAQLEVDKNLQNILKQVPVLENQIGAIIVVLKRFFGLCIVPMILSSIMLLLLGLFPIKFACGEEELSSSSSFSITNI